MYCLSAIAAYFAMRQAAVNGFDARRNMSASGKSLHHLNPEMTAEEPERGGPGSLSFSRAASRYVSPTLS